MDINQAISDLETIITEIEEDDWSTVDAADLPSLVKALEALKTCRELGGR